jgi:hypothetical protein
MTVHFEVVSFAGVLTIATIVDPDHGPELDELTDRLRKEFDSIMAWPGPPIDPSFPSSRFLGTSAPTPPAVAKPGSGSSEEWMDGAH